MPIPPLPRALRRLLLPALLLTTAMPALAQYPVGATVQSLPQPGDPAELLATALRTLAVEPSNLAALSAAGHNALVLGDPNAAVGFFGRAQEIAPRDGRIKAGLGSALVELEKPQDALRLFAEASRLGVPDADIAEDRGLAYDLTGDPKRAQHDYATVLAAHPEDDVARRRLALSQGISGDRAAAIATLDPLIRKRDIAGWRAQTFVLAMVGDTKGASDITHIMLPQQADMLQPFLVRLAALSPADKARAVNFGEMPAAGRAYTPTELANTGAAPTYAASSNAARAAPSPAPRAATRASDLAPMPSPVPSSAARTTVTMAAPQVAVSNPPRIATPTSAPTSSMASEASGRAYQSAPLAGIALTPAKPMPAPQVATQIVPTPTTARAPQPAPVVTPVPTQIAQASPTPSAAAISMPSGPPAPDLPTSAAVGHYDLPHDAEHQPIRTPAPMPVATTPAKTIGTPVVHGETPKVVAPVIAKPERLASADDQPAARATPTRKSSGDTEARRSKDKPAATSVDADASPAKTRGKHVTPSASTDDSEPTPPTRKGAHATKLAAADDATDDGDTPDTKGRKSVHGKRGAADDGDDQVSTTTRKGGRGKTADDGEPSTKSRKGSHTTKLAAADDGEDDGGSRKGGHGKKASDAADAKSSRSSKKDDAKASPERVFVQVAGGANKDDMDKAWAGLKKKAPDLMKGHTPQTAPVHATNRLLVGPFKSDEEAQAFVNKMAGKGLSGFTVKTAKGTKVEKVDSGQ